MKLLNFTVIRSIEYGFCSVLPGLSGGLFAVMLGDYEKTIQIISGFSYRLNYKYLIEIVIGFIAGIKLGAIIINFAVYNFGVMFKYAVIVIYLMSIIYYFKNNHVKISEILIYIIISVMLIIIISNLIENRAVLQTSFIHFFSGAAYSFSKIIPGVSSTSILINLNYYEKLVTFFDSPIRSFAISKFEWMIFWLSFLAFSYFLIKIVDRLLISKVFAVLVRILIIINFVILVK